MVCRHRASRRAASALAAPVRSYRLLNITIMPLSSHSLLNFLITIKDFRVLLQSHEARKLNSRSSPRERKGLDSHLILQFLDDILFPLFPPLISKKPAAIIMPSLKKLLGAKCVGPL